MEIDPNESSTKQPADNISSTIESQPEAPAETPFESPAIIPPAVPPVGQVQDYRPPPARASRTYSIIQLILSLTASLGLFALGLFILVSGLISVIGGKASLADSTNSFLSAAGMIFSGFLVLPSAYFALARVMRWNPSTPGCLGSILDPFRNTNVAFGLMLILLFILEPVVLLIGWMVSRNTGIAWLLLPPIHLIAASIPVAFLVYLGTLRKMTGSPQRKWGAMAAGLILGPSIAVILEIGALITGVIIFIAYIVLNPALAGEFETLAMKLQLAATSEELLLQALTPYLVKPAVIAVILLGVSVIVPLIEETVKPVAVWLLAGKNLTPSQGFAFGVISGSGFALYENLAISITGEMWAPVMIARIGTALLHILTSGLTGWALVGAWRERRYLRLGGIYLAAVLIHGIWNGFAVVTGVWQLNLKGPVQEGLAGQVVALSPYALGFMVVLMFVLLLAVSLSLRSPSEPVIRSEDGSTLTVS